MITHDLNAEEVSNLIKSHLCEDLDITNVEDYTAIRSDKDKFYGMVKVFPNENIVITKDEHDKIIMGATSSDYSALFVAATPDGIFQFHLSLLRLEFEDYVDTDAGIDTKVSGLDQSNGVQVLEWYPEFASEDDYIDALMSNGDDIKVWEDGDNW